MLCSKVLVQAGVKRVCYSRDYDSPLSKELFKKAGVILDQHSPYVTEQHQLFKP
jgi:deoxycytidylate deaminase